MRACTRKYFFPQKSGEVKILFDPQVNFSGGGHLTPLSPRFLRPWRRWATGRTDGRISCRHSAPRHLLLLQKLLELRRRCRWSWNADADSDQSDRTQRRPHRPEVFQRYIAQCHNVELRFRHDQRNRLHDVNCWVLNERREHRLFPTGSGN